MSAPEGEVQPGRGRAPMVLSWDLGCTPDSTCGPRVWSGRWWQWRASCLEILHVVMSQLVFISNKEITEALMSGQEILQRSEKPVRSGFSLPCFGEKSLLKPAARWYRSGPCKQPGNKSGACPLGHFLLNLHEAVFGTYVPTQPPPLLLALIEANTSGR